jgi:hypothetical protein
MDDKEITLTENEGAIIIREETSPEIYVPLGEEDNCDGVRFTLAFLLYAVERDDWVEEFSKFVDSVKVDDPKPDIDFEVEARRASFKVIDGDKE